MASLMQCVRISWRAEDRFGPSAVRSTGRRSPGQSIREPKTRALGRRSARREAPGQAVDLPTGVVEDVRCAPAAWRNRKHAKGWMATLERHAHPVIGNMNVDRIRREDALRVLTPIWARRPETARRVRQRMRAVLRWCWVHGYVSENVAGEGTDGALPGQPAVKQHFRALPYSEVAAALETLEASQANEAAKLCLRFLILTAARSGEARGAMWPEVDPEAREWRVPGHRMKGGAGHRVPLSDAALAVLERARALDDGSGLIFPSPLKAGRPLSNMTLTKVLRDQGLADRATVHGFRSAFRDWCAETGKPREIAEAALAHTVGGVEGAYFRSDLLARRRVLMDRGTNGTPAQASAATRQQGATALRERPPKRMDRCRLLGA